MAARNLKTIVLFALIFLRGCTLAPAADVLMINFTECGLYNSNLMRAVTLSPDQSDSTFTKKTYSIVNNPSMMKGFLAVTKFPIGEPFTICFSSMFETELRDVLIPTNVTGTISVQNYFGKYIQPRAIGIRFQALSQIESANNDFAVGRDGEVSRYQILPNNWEKYSGGKFNPTNSNDALIVARALADGMERSFIHRHGRTPTDFEFYKLFNPHCPDATAQRYANLCGALKN